MRVLGGQVHVAEIALLAVFSFLAYLIGYSLPLVALILMLTWPLLLLQMVFEGLLLGVIGWLRRRRPTQGPPRPAREGLARYLWLTPLVAMTLGYAAYVWVEGKWFL